MAEIAPFDADETRRLECLPFHVFFLVAGADGVIDDKEFERFVGRLIDLAAESGMEEAGVETHLLANSGRYFDSLHPLVKRMVAEGGADVALGAIAAGVALTNAKLDAADAEAFKRHLLELGESVAAASGGVMGVASISRSERAALDRLRETLGPLP